eukprot:764425-Hanusia_phi.AAC.5
MRGSDLTQMLPERDLRPGHHPPLSLCVPLCSLSSPSLSCPPTPRPPLTPFQVLVCISAADLDEAISIINNNPYGKNPVSFLPSYVPTSSHLFLSGSLCLPSIRRLSSSSSSFPTPIHTIIIQEMEQPSSQGQVGQIGINVPIPVPIPYFSFTGSKKSMLGAARGGEALSLSHPKPAGDLYFYGKNAVQ